MAHSTAVRTRVRTHARTWKSKNKKETMGIESKEKLFVRIIITNNIECDDGDGKSKVKWSKVVAEEKTKKNNNSNNISMAHTRNTHTKIINMRLTQCFQASHEWRAEHNNNSSSSSIPRVILCTRQRPTCIYEHLNHKYFCDGSFSNSYSETQQ